MTTNMQAGWNAGSNRARYLAYLLLVSLLCVPLFAQEEEDPKGDDEESSFEDSPTDEEGDRGIRIDPYPPLVPPEQEEPNRPDPVTVGVWQPPKLKPAQQADLDDLLARRAAEPDDLALAYRLADFYLAVFWLPQDR